jgi:uncharacterized RDD family membrane protein YckC
MDIMPSDLPGNGDSPATNPAFSPLREELTIETPEQTDLEFAVAGIGGRFLALAVDTLIQICVGIVVGIAAAYVLGGIGSTLPAASLWAAAILIIFYFLLYFGYFAFFEIIWNGQTPGKRATGIRVIKDTGRPLTPAEAIGRNLMRIVDFLPSLYAVGVVTTLLNKQNKRLGDLLVGSLVVRESSFSELKPVWQPAQPTANLTAAPLGAAQLTPEDAALIESFLHRRLDLPPDVRYRMAEQIFRRIQPKLTLPADNSLSVESVLEALSYEHRSTSGYR